MNKIKIILENKPMRKKPRPQNQSNLKLLVVAFICLLEVILQSNVWHTNQTEGLQLILIVVLIAIFIWMLVLISHHL